MSKSKKPQPTISHELLLAAGYKTYQGSRGDAKQVDYRKCIADAQGTRYIINVTMNDFDQIAPGAGRWWTFKVYFDTPLGTVNIETVQWFNCDGIYTGRTIAEAEAYLDTLFVFHDSPYYEH